MPTPSPTPDPESLRLAEDASRKKNWKRWGPYLSERQWATVREDYSSDGSCWDYFPHDVARSRAYRWGEDGLLGITDRECRLCFSLALWNHHDPILKERPFGLTGPEGNHGEDVKELYYYVDSTPTHSYMKGLYKYPQAAFPYDNLVAENRRRTRKDPEYEITDTPAFKDNRYFDITAEYAKAGPDDILIKLTFENRGPDPAPLTALPTLWFRNTWTWHDKEDIDLPRPSLHLAAHQVIQAIHPTLGTFYLASEPPTSPDTALSNTSPGESLFTENDTNTQRLYNSPNPSPYVKDAFHNYVIHNDKSVVNPANAGTKAAIKHELLIPPGKSITLRLRLCNDSATAHNAFHDFDAIFQQRRDEADTFYAARIPPKVPAEPRNVIRQAYAGLLWSKQFYQYIVEEWRKGDPGMPPPPPGHKNCRNADWNHLYSRDVLSMPDNWEYPWFAAWDLAFHMVALAKVDPDFTKAQLELLLREWYMHPSGQIPAYEFNFSDVNPPVHAWAAWRVYKMTGPRGRRDICFLERCFHKLMLNFTWWVNRKDVSGRHLFAGGFLGLDNIGVFDRSKPLPSGTYLEQADGTAWMAFYCSTMLAIALELAGHNPAYEDIASKFFEHFIAIVDAINTLGGTGLWDDVDGFYYDALRSESGGGASTPLRVRSLVGIVPLFAVETFEKKKLAALPGFSKRMRWFLENRKDLAKNIAYMDPDGHGDMHDEDNGHFLLAVPSRERLQRVLSYIFDENEFLSPYGIRSLSKVHKDHPFSLNFNGETYTVAYAPGESDTSLFGGNSNWRGPIWMPMNYLLLEALERYEFFHGADMTINVYQDKTITLGDAIATLRNRINALFLPDVSGCRPCLGNASLHSKDPKSRNLLQFYEFFHAETGQGLGASHQTGWTALCVHTLAGPKYPPIYRHPPQ